MNILQKKAQGMSINVIIIAVLALLVLVVLAFIFMGKIAVFTETTGSCEKIAGRECAYTCDPGYTEDSSGACLDEDNEPTGKVCCVPVS